MLVVEEGRELGPKCAKGLDLRAALRSALRLLGVAQAVMETHDVPSGRIGLVVVEVFERHEIVNVNVALIVNARVGAIMRVAAVDDDAGAELLCFHRVALPVRGRARSIRIGAIEHIFSDEIVDHAILVGCRRIGPGA